VQVGDLVKFHTASCPGFRLITILGFIHDKTNATVLWVQGFEIGAADQRLYNPEYLEVISASR